MSRASPGFFSPAQSEGHDVLESLYKTLDEYKKVQNTLGIMMDHHMEHHKKGEAPKDCLEIGERIQDAQDKIQDLVSIERPSLK